MGKPVVSRCNQNSRKYRDIIKTNCQVKKISNLIIAKFSPSTDDSDLSNAQLKPTLAVINSLGYPSLPKSPTSGHQRV